MSRIGKLPVSLPENVKIALDGKALSAEGKLGRLSINLPEGVNVVIDGNKVIVSPVSEQYKAKWGLTRTLVSNLVNGVATGFSRKLEISGVGYRAAVKGKFLILSLGYSHEIAYLIPSDIKIECPAPTAVVISGMDKEKIGGVASKIRSFRKVEPYKGSGIRYDNEVVIKKEGKKK